MHKSTKILLNLNSRQNVYFSNSDRVINIKCGWMLVGPYVLYAGNCPIAEQLHNTQRCRVHLNMGL